MALLMATAVTAVILPERLLAFDGLRHGLFQAFGAGVVAAFWTLSPARFNPLLSLVAGFRQSISTTDVGLESAAQTAGAFVGVIAAQAALNLDAVQEPVEGMLRPWQLAPEFFAAFTLVAVSLDRWFTDRRRWEQGVIMGLLFWAASSVTPLATFSNPAATIARTLTSNALSLSPAQAACAVLLQISGAFAAVVIMRPRWWTRR